MGGELHAWRCNLSPTQGSAVASYRGRITPTTQGDELLNTPTAVIKSDIDGK